MSEIDIDLADWIHCWNCDEGYVANCFEEYACVDPESGCDICMRKCDICGGKGGWVPNEDRTAPSGAKP